MGNKIFLRLPYKHKCCNSYLVDFFFDALPDIGNFPDKAKYMLLHPDMQGML